MLFSEIAVWTLAITLNVVTLLFFAEYYETTKLTMLLQAILTTPFPYWAIILLSGTGTFLSIRFADELMDVVHHRDRNFFSPTCVQARNSYYRVFCGCANWVLRTHRIAWYRKRFLSDG
jgi:hypothetical protein